MRALNRKMTSKLGMGFTAMLDRLKMMMRRSTNRNAHIITPHGTLKAGRKGRNG